MNPDIWSDLPEEIWHWYVKDYLVNYLHIWHEKMMGTRHYIECSKPGAFRLSLTGIIENPGEHVWSVETINWFNIPVVDPRGVFLYQVIQKKSYYAANFLKS